MTTEPRVIKRYSNRKLYDTSRSCYITLDEIAELVRQGEAIRIVDNKTKEDLTSVTMAQLLVEQEKRQSKAGGRGLLGGILEQGGELLQKKLGEPVSHLKANVEDQVSRILRTGEERAQETRHQVQSWLEQQAVIMEEAQTRLDERIKALVPGHTASSLARELQRLNDRLDRIEAHLGLAALDNPDEPDRH